MVSKTNVVCDTVDNRDSSVDGAKLDGIESNATADQTGAEIKTAYEAESNAYTDINLFTEKNLPASMDNLLIEDSESSPQWLKKKVQVGNLLADGLEFDAFVVTDFTNWDTYTASTVATVSKNLHWLRVFTDGVDAKASCFCNMHNAVAGALPYAYGFFDIDIDVGWVIGMEDDVATSKTYLLYGPQYTCIDPDLPSIGFRIDNLAAKGIVHNGTSLTVVDLATTMTVNSIFRLLVRFIAGNKIEWYINGVKKGESTNIPSGTETNSHKISVQSVVGADSVAQVINCFRVIFKQKTWG